MLTINKPPFKQLVIYALSLVLLFTANISSAQDVKTSRDASIGLTTSQLCMNLKSEASKIKDSTANYRNNKISKSEFEGFLKNQLKINAARLEKTDCRDEPACMFGSAEHDYYVLVNEQHLICDYLLGELSNSKDNLHDKAYKTVDRKLSAYFYINDYLCAKRGLSPNSQPWGLGVDDD